MTPIRDEWQSDDGSVRLILGDCLEVLPTLDREGIGAVVTDPPYGIGFDRYESHEDSADEYGQFMLALVGHAERLTTGPKAFWQGMPNCSRWHQWFPSSFRLFAACKGFVQFRPTAVQWSWDPVVWWGDARGEASVYRKDFHVQLLAPFGANRERIEHPCPRPLEQTQYVVDLLTAAETTVLDMTMGSGTTGVACIRTGRRFIGIEIEPKYFQIAVKRCQAELERFPLFEREAKPKQLSFLKGGER